MHRLVPKAAVGMALASLALVWAVPGVGATQSGGSAESSAATASSFLGGVNIASVGSISTPAQASAAIASVRTLHANVVRIEIPWAVFEPTSPEHVEPGPLEFTDRLLSSATAAGIRVIMDVDDTPCWASSAPSALLASCRPKRESQANAWPPSNPAGYAAFVAFLAARYGSQSPAIEVWNEPDQANEAYFAGPEKPQRYAAILRAAYPAIKAASPNVQVLAGALVGSNGAFLRELYAAGIKGYYDGLAVHYYNLTLGSLRSIREVQIANGDTTPLWLDEFGWASCWPAHQIEQEQACVTEKTQALNVANTLRAVARTPWVAAAVLYKLQDSPLENFGLIAADGAHKPSFAAFVSAMTAPFGGITRVTVSLRRVGKRVLASGSGPVGDFMQLEVFKGKLLRYKALFTLNRFNQYSIRLPSVLGTGNLEVRVFQYWGGMSKAAVKKI